MIGKGWWETSAPYVGEFFGTFLLTLTYLCNASAGDPIWAVTSNAFMMMLVMYAFSHVSGGNMNPCITLAMWLARRYTFWTALCLCFTQIAGGAAAAHLFFHVAKSEVDLGPKPGFGWWEVMITEVLYTTMIVFVYLNCAASRGNNPINNPNGFVGLAVGLCYIAGGYASMQISGTVMNPAIAVGVQIADSNDELHTSWGMRYLPMEVLGAFMAVSAYRVVRPKELDSSLMCDPNDPALQAPTSARVMSEFLGTFFVVFTKALNNIGKSKAEAWSVAAALAAMQYALRGVSGGHFNPAVTISASTSSCRFCTARNAVLYVGAQILAGLAGSTLYGVVHHGGEIVIRPSRKYTNNAASVVLGEVIFTALLCYSVLTTTAQQSSMLKTRSNDIAGLTIGMCLAVGGFAVGDISGAVLNPAMALGFTGLNVIGGDMFQSTVILYIVYELIGGLMASCIFFLTHASFFRNAPDLPAPNGEPPPCGTYAATESTLSAVPKHSA